MTGMAIAAASYYFAALIGAPAPRVHPVVGGNGGPGRAVILWLLSGPIALMRSTFLTYLWHRSLPVVSVLTLLAAFIWAFCLGVVVLELLFRLFHG